MTRRSLPALLAALAFALPPHARAHGVPERLSFVARLADEGRPVNGTYSVAFAFFDAPDGGTELWTETQPSVQVVEGRVHLEIGAVQPLDTTLFTGEPVYLQVVVDSTRLSPRLPLHSVPYAFRAGVAATAERLGTVSEADLLRRVVAGAGLEGGGASGEVTLGVRFDGSGEAASAARSDHTHAGAYLPLGPVLGCEGSDKVVGFDAVTGSVRCAADLGSSAWVPGAGVLLQGNVIGVDFGGSGGALGTATRAARSDHHHDARYFQREELATGGVFNAATNPVDWTRLKNVPAEFADGDDDTTYLAGPGLALDATTFRADFGGSGAATQVARADHHHAGVYAGATHDHAGVHPPIAHTHDAAYAPLTHAHAGVYAASSHTHTGFLPVGVTTSCIGTNKVRAIDPVTGNVTCAADDRGVYLAGRGLSLDVSTFNLEFGGSGSAETVARSDHLHSAYAASSHAHPGVYIPIGGTLMCEGNEKVRGIMAYSGNVVCGPDDGGTSYDAGAGLLLLNGFFRADFAGTGSEDTVARADHHHAGVYAASGHGHVGEYLPLGSGLTCGGTEAVRGIDPATGDLICAPETGYVAGSGLALDGRTFRAEFDGSGMAEAAARADHDHAGRYLPLGTSLFCSGTQKVWGLDADGSVLCGEDVDTTNTYEAGAGLTLSERTLAVDFAGNGIATTVARSDHHHDAVYLRRGSSLSCTGGQKVVGFDPVSGNVLCGDDLDYDTTYSAGAGMILDGTTLSVRFEGTGTASSAARSDHDHDGQYVRTSGDTLYGSLTLTDGAARFVGTAPAGLGQIQSADPLRISRHDAGGQLVQARAFAASNDWADASTNALANGIYTQGGLNTAAEIRFLGEMCRLCLGHADNNALAPQRCVCSRLFAGDTASLPMNLAGTVDSNDRLWMRFVCDGGNTGVFTSNGAGANQCPW